MTLPDAIVIGPQKAGTTWIHRYLEGRDDVCLPNGVKETMYFDRRFNRDIEWYSRHFRPGPTCKCTVEVAPTYFHHSDVPARIRRVLGEVAVITTLRSPAERSFSLYLHMRRYGMTRCTDFREAAVKHPEIIQTSCYGTHLERWMQHFGRQRILVLFQEDLADQPSELIRKLCMHLAIPFREAAGGLRRPINVAAIPRSKSAAAVGQRIADGLRSGGLYGVVNIAKKLGLKSLLFGKPGAPVPRLTQSERRWLMDCLHPEIDKLEAILQMDLSRWRRD